MVHSSNTSLEMNISYESIRPTTYLLCQALEWELPEVFNPQNNMTLVRCKFCDCTSFMLPEDFALHLFENHRGHLTLTVQFWDIDMHVLPLMLSFKFSFSRLARKVRLEGLDRVFEAN